MRFEGLDLNLLVVFEAIERERSVTRAGSALGLSQPAVSHALTRLRRLLGDRLFVRSPTGMVPTLRASEMIITVRQAIAALHGALRLDAFSPATSTQTFSIAVNNFAAITLAAPLAAACASQAPGVRLLIRPCGTLDTEAMLARGVLDLAIRERVEGARSRSSPLVIDRHVAVLRRDHPWASGRLTSARFARIAHLKISSIDEDDRFVDRELAKHGMTRIVALEAPFLSTSAILDASDMVAVVAHRIAVELCRGTSLIWKPLPFKGPPITIGMDWHDLHDGQPGHAWLRTTIRNTIQDGAKPDAARSLASAETVVRNLGSKT